MMLMTVILFEYSQNVIRTVCMNKRQLKVIDSNLLGFVSAQITVNDEI